MVRLFMESTKDVPALGNDTSESLHDGEGDSASCGVY